MAIHPEVIPVRLAWASPYKAPSVFLGVGEDEQIITEASRVTVDCVAGEAPKIYLEFPGDQGVEDVKLEGVVHIVREVAADPMEVVAGFLADLDGEELDKAVLESMSMGDGTETYGQVALQVLGRWARGD